MVRRTRSFVERNYAYTECPACNTIVQATQEACPNCSRANVRILRQPKTAFFCSAKCPGDVILRTHDAAARWRDGPVPSSLCE